IRSSTSYRWWVLGVVESGNVMATIDLAIVNVALATILREFGIDLETVKWVVVGYTFSITVALITAGRIGDLFGRKRVLVGGYAIFTLASALCALAPSFEVLVAARLVQGVGTAAVLANGTAITTGVFPPDERGRALGINGAVFASGSTIGPALGGFLVSLAGWRSIFLVNLPIGVIAVLLGAAVMRDEAPDEEVGSPV